MPYRLLTVPPVSTAPLTFTPVFPIIPGSVFPVAGCATVLSHAAITKIAVTNTKPKNIFIRSLLVRGPCNRDYSAIRHRATNNQQLTTNNQPPTTDH